MSNRKMFLSGALIATMVLIGVVLASQVYNNQAASLTAPVANAQPRDTNPSAPLSGAQLQVTPAPTQTGTISVSGTGRASAAPDIAHMTFGVEAVGPDVSKVVSEVTSKQSAIIAKLKSMGVADKDVQTTSFNVNIERKPAPQGSTPEGPLTYRAINTAQVTIRKTDQIAALIEAAVQSGANNIYGVGFSVSDNTPMMSEARTKAVADARSKAEALAKAAGLKLGRIVNITEGLFPGPQPVFAADSRTSASGIETGELQVIAQVQVVFAIEPQ